MEHFYTPRNHFRLANADVIGTAGDPARGEFMQIFLRFAHGRIAEASFQTIGCCPAIAAGSLLTERLRGATQEESEYWTESAVNDALGGLPVEKRFCSALAAIALKDALASWGRRSSTMQAGPERST
jgi:NifU-like protein involved in Fe-S cluster formation